MSNLIKVLHVSYSDYIGGASLVVDRINSALNCHSGLEGVGIHSSILCLHPKRDQNVDEPASQPRKLLIRFIAHRMINYISTRFPKLGLLSFNLYPSGLGEKINRHEADVIHLHWIGGEALSLSEIKSINKPIIWSVHDMWPLTGLFHYSFSIYWQNNAAQEGNMMERFMLRRLKATLLDKKITFVASSAWMYKNMKQASICEGHEVKLVPYPFDSRAWTRAPDSVDRVDGNFRVLFIADNAASDHRKGLGMLMNALSIVDLSGFRPRIKITLKVVGISENDLNKDLLLSTDKVTIEKMAKISDVEKLKYAFSNADVLVIPSLLENFGMVGAEAQLCGTPVVTFATTGAADTVSHRQTGFLAAELNANSLACALYEMIQFWLDPNRMTRMRTKSIARAREIWCPSSIALRLSELYREKI